MSKLPFTGKTGMIFYVDMSKTQKHPLTSVLVALASSYLVNTRTKPIITAT